MTPTTPSTAPCGQLNRKGNYVLNSLGVIYLAAAVFLIGSNTGSFGPINIRAVGPRSLSYASSSVDANHSGIESILKSISAALSAPVIEELCGAESGSLSDSETIMPNASSAAVYMQARKLAVHLECLKTIPNCLAKRLESGSALTYSIRTIPGFFSSASINLFWCVASARQASCAFRRSASSRASAASFSATASLWLERSRNSVWMRLFRIPNKTSPIIPTPITASGQMDNFKNVSYGGSYQAMMSSAATERITNTPHHKPQPSQEDDAFSNSFSEAVFVPFGRYHAGKNRIRNFIFALLFGSLFWVAVFAWWWHLGWLQ